ncbi:mediator subunit of RNA polymerase II [Scheffersomyces stipitis CBS 6054]|uniref:Mediator of RNA polymerase II transcription subunit 11 n=1 Tax=Scheffersomyces stipitis (strain ATCC 58785 / CBS 6054 / NBRC 10063 / NRRL Y-11545) TaxID=322104 RepID=MED11_PICST|nr:mediator subunit of RNA polymerase II [Scheffersomyces stipitis CBS 6054]A3LWI0.2 RecName: Full=Mediator of RNA polymerase II transcription subunit 11; AltName: Full=Mediator complex subunit 11 [Scheffersomyces stipitis CBS 6054]ABN66976.2 mediator subunit of RNA polymerase II [Scheffersomyces stipitis CBS 6054]
MSETFIQERLDSLYEIDCKIVSLLDNISTLFQTYSSSDGDVKESFASQTEEIYSILSKVAIDLRKEVKVMDDNIGVYDKNKDGVMILPIGVDQKNTTLGRKKLNEELKELEGLLPPVSKSNEEDISMADAEQSVEIEKNAEEDKTQVKKEAVQESITEPEKSNQSTNEETKETQPDQIESKDDIKQETPFNEINIPKESTSEPELGLGADIDIDMDNNDNNNDDNSNVDDLFEDIL